MKKLLTLAMVLAFATITTQAFAAVSAELSGTLQARAISVDNVNGGVDDSTDDFQEVDQRLRLYTTAKANDKAKMVLALEVDNVFGDTTADTPPNHTKEVGTMGADAKGQLEIKNLYMEFKPGNATVAIGTKGFKFGDGIVINDDAAGVQVDLPCPVVPDNKLSLVWIKAQEKAETVAHEQDNDADFYGATYSAKIGGVSVAPYVGYAEDRGNAYTMWYGATVSGKAGGFGYAVNLIQSDWESQGTSGGELAYTAKATFAAGAFGLAAEYGHMGDKKNGGNFASLAQSNATGPIVNISEIMTGGRFASNTTAINYGGAGQLYKTNWEYAKLSVDYKLNDSTKVSGYVATISEAEATGAAAPAKDFGTEVAVYLDYKIVDNVNLTLVAAQLMADDDFGADDASKYAAAVTYSF